MMGYRVFEDGGSFRVELRPLDPDLDPQAAGRFVDQIATRIGARGACARVPVDPLYGLWALPRPLLVAASIIGLALVGIASRAGSRESGAPSTTAESIGVPLQLLATRGSHP